MKIIKTKNNTKYVPVIIMFVVLLLCRSNTHTYFNILKDTPIKHWKLNINFIFNIVAAPLRVEGFNSENLNFIEGVEKKTNNFNIKLLWCIQNSLSVAGEI